MKALILAGGKGARLRPYTTVLPKPLMPVGDFPILEVILRQLGAAGIRDVILAVGHLGQLFEAFFRNGERLGMKIEYTFEEHPLGTAGPIASVVDRMGDDFLVMNGDLLTTLSFKNLIDAHARKNAAATIAAYQRDVRIDFGVVEKDEANLLRDYIEKPTYHFLVSMGVNVLNRAAVRRYVKQGEYLDIPALMIQMRRAGEVVHCHQQDCFWLDIGRVDDYQAAVEVFEQRKREFLGDDW